MGKHTNAQARHALVAGLSSNDPEVREHAASSLRRRPQYDMSIVIPALVVAARDPNDNVSSSAVETLGSLGTAALPAFLELFNEPNVEIRLNAIRVSGI